MNILAIDPGPVESAYVLWRDGQIVKFEKHANRFMLLEIGSWVNPITVVCEMVACYGMPVGAEVFETCAWVGRYWQMADIHRHDFHRVFRKDVKMHLCGNMRAKDGNIRQALIDKLGPQGKKTSPGPTYGISGDVWAALAVAVTFAETRKQ